MVEKKVRDVIGVIAKVTDMTVKPLVSKSDGKPFNIYGVGIQFVDGSWHNVEKYKEEPLLEVMKSTTLDRIYRVGDHVKIYEECKDAEGKYWKVVSIVALDTKPVAPKADGTVTGPPAGNTAGTSTDTTCPEPTPTKVKTGKSTIDPEHIIILQGKEFITHAGLLDIAHAKGLVSIETELIDSGKESGTAIVQAKATFKDGKTFTGIGDANKENVNSMILPHKIRMAETRGVNRALRFGTNIGMCSSEELGGDKKEK